MDAGTPKPSINLAQKELDVAKARYAADKARKVAEAEVLNGIRPDGGLSLPSRPVGDAGRPAADEEPLPALGEPGPART